MTYVIGVRQLLNSVDVIGVSVRARDGENSGQSPAIVDSSHLVRHQAGVTQSSKMRISTGVNYRPTIFRVTLSVGSR